jgi:hypothetical protein
MTWSFYCLLYNIHEGHEGTRRKHDCEGWYLVNLLGKKIMNPIIQIQPFVFLRALRGDIRRIDFPPNCSYRVQEEFYGSPAFQI